MSTEPLHQVPPNPRAFVAWLAWVESTGDMRRPSLDYLALAIELQRMEFHPEALRVAVEKVMARAERWERWEAILDASSAGAPRVMEAVVGCPDGE